jgi:hypothetical protein
MQCPICQQELADQTHCENCARKDGASTEAAPAPEGNTEQGLADDSNAPLAPEVRPQAADSLDQPAEPEPTAVNEPPSRETATPASTTETTVNSKGDQRILGRASQTISDSDLQAARDITIAGQIHYHPGAQPGKTDEEIPLYSLTHELPQRVLELHESARAEVRGKVAQLKATRLMFIACPHAQFAVDAGHVAVGGLRLDNPAQTRELLYEDAARKNLEFTAPKLLEQIPEEKDERAILVYAQSADAQSFLDSIFDTPGRIDHIRSELQRGGLFLVVIVAPQNAQKRLSPLKRNSPFAYAEIPFLRPFLRGNYPDGCEKLEAEINDQRARGKWEKEETNFCQQILDLSETGKLEAVVASGGPDDPRLSAESLLKESKPVEKVVLYAAAFFQEISAPEFHLVVESLLEGRTEAVAAPTNGAKEADARPPAEVPLSRTWELDKDRIFNKQLRETSAGKDSVRVVSLSNSALREPLRRLFEQQHRFYLIDQFNALQERGIFFHPSIRLSENAARIAVQMSDSYPDKFNEHWVVDLVGRLRRHFESDSSDAPDGEGAMFRFLRSSWPGTYDLALARVSAVLRRMLKSEQLKGVVQSSFERLIKGGYHEDTLLLIKHLQSSPEFDALYWFKQLLHRADNHTRLLTYFYLYAYLKRMGGGVFEGFRKIEAWLPPPERDPGNYSQFDSFVLRLLIQYCVETVARFNGKHYGDWPSRYQLLAAKDREAADERTSLLARWLLHPGIKEALVRLRMSDTQMTLIGALLAEWAFILLGPAGAVPADGSGAPGGDGGRALVVPAEGARDEPSSAVMVFDLLIRQFASRTNLAQRLELLKYWNSLDHDLLRYLVALPAASALRNQVSWKRELVRKLITRIKSAQSALKAPPKA